MKQLNGYPLIIYMLMSVLGASTSVMIHSVGSLRETGSVRCGSRVTFVCSIPTYKYTMKWLIASDEVAECVTTNCVQYPPYKVDNIEFSPDTSNGEFNMTINPVSFKADGRKIKCLHGPEGVELEMAVKVLPTKRTTEIVESIEDTCNMNKITVMTGCVFPRSAITMQWYYYQEGHTPKLYKMSSPVSAIYISVCSAGPCGSNGVVKISSTLFITEEQNGKEYFFQIAIRHKDTGDVVLVNSTRSYKINDVTPECQKETSVPIVVKALCIYITTSLLFFVTICVVLKVKGKLPNLRNRRQFIPSAATFSVDGYVHTINNNMRSTIRTRNASNSELKLLDETEDEENNDDSGSNDSTSKTKTKHM